jgi:hypothetical protein
VEMQQGRWRQNQSPETNPANRKHWSTKA